MQSVKYASNSRNVSRAQISSFENEVDSILAEILTLLMTLIMSKVTKH